MKIAMVTVQFPTLSETFILNQITGLIDRGHDVEIFSLFGSEVDVGGPQRLHPQIEKYRLLEKITHLKVPESRLTRIAQSLRLLLGRFFKGPGAILRSLNVARYGKESASLTLLFRTLLLLDKGPYDVIHCQFGPIGREVLELVRIGAFKGKLVSSFRGHDISSYLKKHGEDIYNDLFASGELFLPNCDFFKKRLVKLGCDENKIVVIRSGLDCKLFQNRGKKSISSGKKKIVTVGRFVEKKGIEYSLRAVADVVEHNKDIEYSLIGDGPLRSEFESLVQELGIGEFVNFLGAKNQKEIIEILENSDIFVAPSVTAKNGDQDAPVNVLKEAMALGLPVVSTLHGGIPELVEDGVSGYLVEERDAKALAEKLSYLIEHPELWEKMGQAGRTMVEKNYDLDQLIVDLEQAYLRTLNKG